MKAQWIARRVIGGIAMFAVATLLLGTVLMLLWNAVVPDVFRGPAITFWQAIGLFILTRILFHGMGHGRWGHRWRHDRWKHRMDERMSAMAPEEREKFRKRWERCCGTPPESDEDAGKPSAPAA